MLDETLLDDPEGLARADTRGRLLGVAAAGARVRTAARLAQEAGIGELKPDGRPRSVLVAGPGAATAAAVAELLAALGSGSAPVLPLRPTGPAPYDLRWTLPGWAGPLDLLLIATPTGTEAGIADLIEQAYRRGCTAAAVVPAGSPIAEAIAQVRGMVLPYAAAPESGAPDAADPDEDLGAFWALLTPLLALGDRIGLLPAPADAIERVADRLDEVAARCGPAIATYSNPAKALASELAESLPVLWSEGPLAAVAARRFAATIASRAGRPALHGELPEAVDTHGALLAGALAGALDPDDFFRDRVEEPEDLRLRVVLLHRPGNGTQAPATSSAAVAREFTTTHDTPLSELAAGADGTPLESVVELLAVTDFASVYLAVTSAGRS
ncbi:MULTISPECIES: SIS domain-containing protein [unclassified Streptomyces]|uniref:SIS domain-containing protein n=1 Tax=unclassified Streptomyces TaxID=2593676 RepID=UPI00380EAD06